MDIRGKKGAWINQYAKPAFETFMDRAADVDYIIVKFGLGAYEKLSVEAGKPWLAERMADGHAGNQNAWRTPDGFATELVQQAREPGCVGAVLNLEEADGGWHLDNGTGTRRLITLFRQQLPQMPLYASLDTRGNRPDLPYQRVCAELCDGVMPMVYPQAFYPKLFVQGQGARACELAFNDAVSPKVLAKWKGRIFPTIQAYGSIGALVPEQLRIARMFDGVNVYTLGHATQAQWDAVAAHTVSEQSFPIFTNELSVPLALAQLRVRWLETMMQLAKEGTPDEVAAFAAYWKNLAGKGG